MIQFEQTFMNFLLQHQEKYNRTYHFLILIDAMISAARHIQHYYLKGTLKGNLGLFTTYALRSTIAFLILMSCLYVDKTAVRLLGDVDITMVEVLDRGIKVWIFALWSTADSLRLARSLFRDAGKKTKRNRNSKSRR